MHNRLSLTNDLVNDNAGFDGFVDKWQCPTFIVSIQQQQITGSHRLEEGRSMPLIQFHVPSNISPSKPGLVVVVIHVHVVVVIVVVVVVMDVVIFISNAAAFAVCRRCWRRNAAAALSAFALKKDSLCVSLCV